MVVIIGGEIRFIGEKCRIYNKAGRICGTGCISGKLYKLKCKPVLLEEVAYANKVDDIDLWELNEAFAVQVAYCRDQLGISMDKLNVNGGSISIGHPFGMTGSRQVGHIVRELNNQDKQFGIVTMCVGGGMGATGLFERYPS